MAANRNRRQRVVYGEATRDRDVYGKLLRAGGVEVNADEARLCDQLIAVRDEIGFFVVAVALDIAGMTLDDLLCVVVVDIDDAVLAYLEQKALAL